METSKIKGKINWKSQGNSKYIKNKWIISFHTTSNIVIIFLIVAKLPTFTLTRMFQICRFCLDSPSSSEGSDLNFLKLRLNTAVLVA